MRPQIPYCLEFVVFDFVLFWPRTQAHASPLTDNPHLFFVLLSIMDILCLVLYLLFNWQNVSARGRIFARNNLLGRDKQSHLGFVVLGPALP